MAKNWTDQEILNVWQKGTIVLGYDKDKYRKDECGAWMEYGNYGNRSSILSWEIDHITPVANGGKDILSNLRPLQWRNNLDKSDGRLKCNIVAVGDHNIDKLKR